MGLLWGPRVGSFLKSEVPLEEPGIRILITRTNKNRSSSPCFIIYPRAIALSVVRFRAKRKHLNRFQELFSEIQGQNLVLTVLYVPSSLGRDLSEGAGVEAFATPLCKGSTSFEACDVRCWRWLFGNKIPVSFLKSVSANEICYAI